MYLKSFLLIALSVTGLSCTNSSTVQPIAENRAPAVPTQTRIDRQWQPATYLGLRLGTATIDNLITVLGKPSATADLTQVGNDKDVRYVFDNVKTPAHGQLAAWVDKQTRVIREIEFALDHRSDHLLTPASVRDALKRKDLDRLFGTDYQITKYASDACVEAPFDATALYESPDGEFSYLEYREKGLAIAMNETREAGKDASEDHVTFVLYLSEPIGSAESQCK